MYPEYPAPPNQPNPDYPGSPNPYAPNPQYPGSPNPYAPNPQPYPSPNPQYAPNPPNPSYPGAANPQYAPPGAYPPNYAPSGPQAPSSPYGSAPSGVYGAPPTSPVGAYPPVPPIPPQRRNSPLPIILSIVGAVVILALVAVGAYFALKPGNPSTNITPTATTAIATATLAPTATATPNVTASYTENRPACDTPNDWSVTSSQVTCGASAMTLTNAANAHTLAEASFNGTGSGFGASYDVSVNISNITNACAGMVVLGDNNQGVGVYLCNDGSWFVNQYSASGAPKTLGSGNAGAVTLSSSNLLDITVTPSNIVVNAEAASLTTVPRSDTLKTTYIALAVENGNEANAASAGFDTFSYAAIS
ncbi:MAG TPA: hypothetical protein VMV29_05270 [Ktedonobacterales bacterium]|nr:hypothetical protein [Ktedonobacterales bacterium]